MIKRNLILLAGLLCCLTGLYAQDHKLEVRNLKKWGHQYLTVTNNWNGLLVTPIEGELPPLLAVITEINGKSTEGMSSLSFYKILDGSNEVSLSYLQKENGRNVPKHSVLSVRQNYYIAGGIVKNPPLAKPKEINIASAPDVDFFDYCTFDYRVEGDDQLTDRNILDEISEVFVSRGMKRETNNPDLIISIQKSLQQSTNSVYVPETKHVVNTGSTTTLQRNIFTGKKYLATYQNNQVITSGGYTHTGVSATFHLVLTIQRNVFGEGSAESALPTVWKLDYNVFSSKAIDIMDQARGGVSYWCLNYPFAEPMFSYDVKTLGIVFASPFHVSSGEIVDVLEGTDAYKKGLMAGDKITSGYIGGYITLVFNRARLCFFKPNSSKKMHWSCGFVYFIPYPFPCKDRGYNNDIAYLTNDYAGGGIKQHYKILHSDGTKDNIRGPFKLAEYDYEYMY